MRAADFSRWIAAARGVLGIGLAVAGIMLLNLPAFCQEMILVEKLRQQQIQKASFTLVDVRSPDEFERRHIEGALNIRKEELVGAALPKDRALILYCNELHCPLSHAAAKTLIDNGYKHVGILYGGIAEWEHRGYPIVPLKDAVNETVSVQADMSASDLRARLQNQQAIIVLDLRPTPEFVAGHLPGARSVPLEKFPDGVKEIAPVSEILAYDRVPQRSKDAVRQLTQSGFSARALSGGIQAWSMMGYPLEAGSRSNP